MTIDDTDEYEFEKDETCDCGNYSCPICSSDNHSPLTDEQEEAKSLLEDNNDIDVENISYRHDGEFDEYDNLILTSNDTDETQITLNIRELQHIEGRTLYFKNQDEIEYKIKI